MNRPSQNRTSSEYHAPFTALEAVSVFCVAFTLFLLIGLAFRGVAAQMIAQLVGLGGVPLAWALIRQVPLRDLGFAAARPRQLVGALLVGMSFWWLNFELSTWLIGDAIQDPALTSHLRSRDNMWVSLVSLALIPGITEEVLVRGTLTRSLIPPFGVVLAVVASSFIFAAFHLQWPRLAPLFLLGVVCGSFVIRTGSLWPAIIVHVANNGMVQLVYHGAAGAITRQLGFDLPAFLVGSPVTSSLLAGGLCLVGGTLVMLRSTPRVAPDLTADSDP